MDRTLQRPSSEHRKKGLGDVPEQISAREDKSDVEPLKNGCSDVGAEVDAFASLHSPREDNHELASRQPVLGMDVDLFRFSVEPSDIEAVCDDGNRPTNTELLNDFVGDKF